MHTYRGLKRALDLLELELQATISCLVGAGNGAQVLWKSTERSFQSLFLFLFLISENTNS